MVAMEGLRSEVLCLQLHHVHEGFSKSCRLEALVCQCVLQIDDDYNKWNKALRSSY